MVTASSAARVVVIGGGRVLADDTVAAVRGLVAIRRVSLTSPGPLPSLDGLLGVEQEGDRLHLLTPDADRLVRDLVDSRRNVGSYFLIGAFAVLPPPRAGK